MIGAGEYSKKKVKSGKWAAKINHPISKVWVLLGIYTTPEEAEDACAIKKVEYQSCSSQGTDVSVYEKQKGIKRLKSGKWSAQIQHNNVVVWLGTYNSPKEAANSYILSRLELDSQKSGCSRKVDELDEPTVEEMNTEVIDCEQSGRTRRVDGTGSVNKTKSGKWRAEIGIRKARHHVGTYATREDAEAAIHLKKTDLFLKAEKAKEAYTNKKQKHGNDSRQSNDPFVCIDDGTSVFKANREEEEEAVRNVNDESIGEFDIVNEYGQLVGEYSRIDDDLWLSW